jgi:hypothetical protein
VIAVVCLTRHIIAGHGCRTAEYRAGDVVLAGMAEAMEWCLRGWAEPQARPPVALDLPQKRTPVPDRSELPLAA